MVCVYVKEKNKIVLKVLVTALPLTKKNTFQKKYW